MASPNNTKTGSIKVVAMIRVTTKYLKGLVPDTSIASICSVTRIEPSSAPIPEPILPAQIKAVIIGPISRIIEILTIDGIQETAPNSIRVGRDCKSKTNPIINPVTATRSKERFPM
ncbi:hypothetical protein D3C72_1486070 [compost metagenome]